MTTDVTPYLHSMEEGGYTLAMSYASLLGIALGLLTDEQKAKFHKYAKESS